MKTLIVGAGAIGCLLGAKLALAGADVTLAGRQRTVAAVQTNGLRLDDEIGAHTISEALVVESVAAAFEQADAQFDLAILTVKAYDTAVAIGEIVDALEWTGSGAPTILSLQNGVGNEQVIAESLGQNRVIGGAITTPVTVLETAHIQVDKPKYTIGIGRWQPSGDASPFEQVKQLLRNAGFSVTAYADARSLKWTKLLMNMVGNATSAILDEPPDVAFEDSGIVDIEIDAWREALAVMAALELDPINLGSYPFATYAPWIRNTPKMILRPVLRQQVGGARGGKMPSLHIDLHGNKGKNEVGWLNGAVVRAGRKVKVPTPVNQALTTVLTSLIHDPGKRSLWQHNRLRLVVCVEEYRARVETN